MTALRSIVGTLAVLALLHVEPAGGDTLPAAPIRDLLGAIDYVPTAAMIGDVMGATPNAELATLAIDPDVDAGIRLRALRALTHYPTDFARDTLGAVLISLGAATTGRDVLLLRAAIEALGEIGGPDDVPTITPFLAVGSSPEVCAGLRDVRATAAHALQAIGSPTGVPPLRARQVPGPDKEPCEQVSLAITEALRALLGGT